MQGRLVVPFEREFINIQRTLGTAGKVVAILTCGCCNDDIIRYARGRTIVEFEFKRDVTAFFLACYNFLECDNMGSFSSNTLRFLGSVRTSTGSSQSPNAI